MSKNPIFSVLMAAHNEEANIQRAIESYLAQDFSDTELIIVDDGSTDDTGVIADEYEKQHPEITVIHREASGSASAARNTGLGYCKGDYLQFLDADDHISADFFDLCNKRLKDDPDLDVIVPVLSKVDGDGREISATLPPDGDFEKVIDGESAYCYSMNDWQVHGTCCFRRSLVEGTGYNNDTINGDEYTLHILLYMCKKVGFCRGIYYYFQNEKSTTRSLENRVRMYEYLDTDRALLEFAVTHEMSDRCVEVTAQKLLFTYQFFYARFQSEADMLSPASREEIEKKLALVQNFIVSGMIREGYSRNSGRQRILTGEILDMIETGIKPCGGVTPDHLIALYDMCMQTSGGFLTFKKLISSMPDVMTDQTGDING